MALTFNGATKTVTWTGGPLSVIQLWSRYLDWLKASEANRRYTPLLSSVGRDTTDIPLYVFLQPGVTIVITNNTVVTPITDGVLKVTDGHDPFGGAVVNIRYEAPGIAIGYSSNGVTGPTAAEIAAAVWSHTQ